MATCRYCGAHHGVLCPMVKAYEYYPSDGLSGGSLKRVEFFTRAELDAQFKFTNPLADTSVGMTIVSATASQGDKTDG